MGDQFMGGHLDGRDDFKTASMVQPMGIGIISQGDINKVCQLRAVSLSTGPVLDIHFQPFPKFSRII